MHVISLLAQKGGVGKTTLALHWAVEAHQTGHDRVAVIDMDLQASAAKWYERRHKSFPLLLRAEKDTVVDAVAACQVAGMDLVLIDTMPRADDCDHQRGTHTRGDRHQQRTAQLSDQRQGGCGATAVRTTGMSGTDHATSGTGRRLHRRAHNIGTSAITAATVGLAAAGATVLGLVGSWKCMCGFCSDLEGPFCSG